MRSLGGRALLVGTVLALGGCAEILKSATTVNAMALNETFETATTAAGCRAAHEALSFRNGQRTADQRIDQASIDADMDRCFDRVADLPRKPNPRDPIQGDGLPFCPPYASVLYGGSAYCVRL